MVRNLEAYNRRCSFVIQLPIHILLHIFVLFKLYYLQSQRYKTSRLTTVNGINYCRRISDGRFRILAFRRRLYSLLYSNAQPTFQKDK